MWQQESACDGSRRNYSDFSGNQLKVSGHEIIASNAGVPEILKIISNFMVK